MKTSREKECPFTRTRVCSECMPNPRPQLLLNVLYPTARFLSSAFVCVCFYVLLMIMRMVKYGKQKKNKIKISFVRNVQKLSCLGAVFTVDSLCIRAEKTLDSSAITLLSSPQHQLYSAALKVPRILWFVAVPHQSRGFLKKRGKALLTLPRVNTV